MRVKIVELTSLPGDFLRLRDESISEGFRFLDKMKTEWESGENRFDHAGEKLFGAFIDELLVGIGGINVDHYLNDHRVGRVRHLYIQKKFRRSGVGRGLVERILSHGAQYFDRLTLRTDTLAASHFYESIGFAPISSETASHEFIFR